MSTLELVDILTISSLSLVNLYLVLMMRELVRSKK